MPTKKMLLALVSVAVLFGVLLALGNSSYPSSRLLSSDVTNTASNLSWVINRTTALKGTCSDLCSAVGGTSSDQCYDSSGQQCTVLNLMSEPYSCSSDQSSTKLNLAAVTGSIQTIGPEVFNIKACCCQNIPYSSSLTSSQLCEPRVDGGVNPFIKGSVRYRTSTDATVKILEDTCISGTDNLRDYFCDGKMRGYVTIDCSGLGGCNGGKCTTEPIPSVPSTPVLSFIANFPSPANCMVDDTLNITWVQSGYASVQIFYTGKSSATATSSWAPSQPVTVPASQGNYAFTIPQEFVPGSIFQFHLEATNTSGDQTTATSGTYTIVSSAVAISCQTISGGVQVNSGDETIYYLDNCADNILHRFTCAGDVKNETVTTCSASQTCSIATGCTTTSTSPSCAATGQNYYRSAQNGPTNCCSGLVKKRGARYVPGSCSAADSSGVCTTYNSGYCDALVSTGGVAPEGSCVADASWNCGNGTCDAAPGEDRCNCPEDCSSYDTSIDSEAEGQIITAAPFTDTASLNSLEVGAVTELYNRGIIGGYEDGEFKGVRSVNRAEAAKFLIYTKYQGGDRDTQVGNLGNDNKFYDVLDGEWYTRFVMKAAALGVINGYGDHTFRPADTINTVEFLKMLKEAFGYNTTKGTGYGYVDVDGNAWYAQYLPVAYNCQLFPKRDAAYLEPARLLTRTEVAVAIYNYFQNGCNSL